jgi:hypothetical protein
MTAPSPLDRVTFRGATVNRGTRSALLYVEEQLGPRFPALQIAKGSYRQTTATSGPTHHGGGVVDLRIVPISPAQALALLRTLRACGWAAWIRDHRDGFDPHIHACIFGDGGQDMHSSAQWQRREYDAGRNALTNGRPDRYTFHPDPKVKWSWSRNQPVRRA